MPDWSYQTVFKPLLFRMSPERARMLTLNAIGGLASLPFGAQIIDFMGHMLPQSSEARLALQRNWMSRVGLGAGISFDSASLQAFSRFGFGYLEVGPVTVQAVRLTSSVIQRCEEKQDLVYPGSPENPGLDVVEAELKKTLSWRKKSEIQVGIRLASIESEWHLVHEQYKKLTMRLASFADFISLDTRWWNWAWTDSELSELLDSVQKHCKRAGKSDLFFLLISPDIQADRVERLLRLALEHGVSGLIVGGGLQEPSAKTAGALKRVYGKSTKPQCIQLLNWLREKAPAMLLIGSGGIIEPQDALDYIEAGAAFVQIHSGFVYAGPGLPKRINEALNDQQPQQAVDLFEAYRWNQGWQGFALVAIGLMVASGLALHVGLTSVLLPYDEAFLKLPADRLAVLNPHLLHFMRHDRVTLAGTALSGAVLYLFLALSGVKVGHHWAYRTLVLGIGAGFLSFFLYLGFRYFDPLHALVCLLVLPFYCWGILRPPNFVPERSCNLRNDRAWRRSLWSQLFFVLIGIGLILAGLTIAVVGCTNVFVHEDLMFMHTTRDTLAALNPRLIQLISHDRASFGGFLWSVGLVVLLIALQGYRQGSRWIWWALLLGGLPGFLAVLCIHFSIGYTHFIHLFPAYIAFGMYVLGLYLSYDYLCVKPASSIKSSQKL